MSYRGPCPSTTAISRIQNTILHGRSLQEWVSDLLRTHANLHDDDKNCVMENVMMFHVFGEIRHRYPELFRHFSSEHLADRLPWSEIERILVLVAQEEQVKVSVRRAVFDIKWCPNVVDKLRRERNRGRSPVSRLLSRFRRWRKRDSKKNGSTMSPHLDEVTTEWWVEGNFGADEDEACSLDTEAQLEVVGSDWVFDMR